MRPSLLLVAASIIAGCISSHTPLVADKNYPPGWEQPGAAGSECKAIEATYDDSGSAVDADGGAHGLSLLELLGFSSNTTSVSLAIRTDRTDRDGDTSATLLVTPAGDSTAYERHDCFCLKQTLACTRIGEQYGGIPGLAIGGSESIAYLTVSAGGDLVGRLQNLSAGVVLFVPVFHGKQAWVRFPKAHP